MKLGKSMSGKYLLAYGGLLLSLATACQTEPPRNANNAAPLAATPSAVNPTVSAPTPAPAASVNATPAATTALTPQANNAGDADYLITPGQSIGKIALDMPRSQVHELLGKPMVSYTLKDVLVDSWRSEQGTDIGQVYYRDNKAAQIEVSAPRFATANGLSTKSTLAQVQKALPGLKQTVQRTVGEGEISEVRFLDATQSGITFSFRADTGRTVMVHKAGAKPLLDIPQE